MHELQPPPCVNSSNCCASPSRSSFEATTRITDFSRDRSFRANCVESILRRSSCEIWTIVGPDEQRDTAQDDHVASDIDDVAGVQFAIHADGQTFPAVFIALQFRLYADVSRRLVNLQAVIACESLLQRVWREFMISTC